MTDLSETMYEAAELLCRHVVKPIALQLVVAVFQPTQFLFDGLCLCCDCF